MNNSKMQIFQLSKFHKNGYSSNFFSLNSFIITHHFTTEMYIVYKNKKIMIILEEKFFLRKILGNENFERQILSTTRSFRTICTFFKQQSKPIGLHAKIKIQKKKKY